MVIENKGEIEDTSFGDGAAVSGKVTNEQTLRSALQMNGATVVLENDITVQDTLTITNDITLDLGGHTLALTEADGLSILLHIYGNVTVQNGSLKSNGSWGVIYTDDNSLVSLNANVFATQSDDGYSTLLTSAGNSVVNIYGGNYENSVVEDDGSGHYDLIYATETSTINVYGGTFKNYTPKWTLNCQDKHDDSHVYVYGGKFYMFDPSKAGIKDEGDTFVGENEVLLAEGYVSVAENHDDVIWYTVKAISE